MSAPWQLSVDSFLSEAEVQRLLDRVRTAAADVAPQERESALLDRVIIEGLLYSGLRSTEFCGLLLGDTSVGLVRPVLRVSGTRQNDREVHIPRELDDLLREYIRDVRPARLPAGVDPADLHQPLILNERRRPYERTALYRRVVRILQAAGLGERASVQLLRHTYGYLAYKRTGGNLLFVQQQLGHAHPMVTAVYAEFVPFDYHALANRTAGAGWPSPLSTEHT
jgi:integrase